MKSNSRYIRLPSLCTVPEEYVGKTVDADIVGITDTQKWGDITKVNLSIDGKECYDGWVDEPDAYDNTANNMGYHYYKREMWLQHFGLLTKHKVELGELTDVPVEKGGYKANITVLRNKIGKIYIKLNHITKDGNVIAIKE